MKGIAADYICVSGRARVFMNQICAVKTHLPRKRIGCDAMKRYETSIETRGKIMKERADKENAEKENNMGALEQIRNNALFQTCQQKKS